MQSARFGILALLAAGLVLGGCVRDYGSARSGGPTARSATTSVVHTVVAGDNTISIARLYGVAPEAIIRANDLTKRDLPLQPGRTLVIPGGRPPAPATAPDPEPTERPATGASEPVMPATGWYVPRSAWAVEPIVLSRINPMGGRPNRITLHHTAMDGIDNGPDATAILRLIDSRHHGRIGRGGENGACIGYHFLIARDGTVYEGRPLQYQGAHAGGDNNKLNIGICLLGDFERNQVPAAQKAATIAVVDRMRATYGISRSQVHGHKDFNPPGTLHTECPGRCLYPLVLAYRRGQIGREAQTGTTPPMATATRP